MTGWPAIRSEARRHRQESLASADSQGGLVPAEELIECALNAAGLCRLALPLDDPLLAGAHAVLDRQAGYIWNRAGLSPETTRFNIAHELAHWWLHSDSRMGCREEDIVDSPVAEPLPFGEAYVAGYSPAQRREVEANVFAAEFLLPAPLIESLFLSPDPPNTSESIAAAIGISETVVLGQMAETLLLDDRRWTMDDTSIPPCETDSYIVDRRSSIVDDLDPSQKLAAEMDRGPALITAGPGTGKTRTLVARILALLDRGAAPEQILALTFSNRAANEMRLRLAEVVPAQTRRLWIGTFHAFGLELLRRFGTRIGLPADPKLIDPVDAVSLLENNLARLDLVEYEYLHRPSIPFRDILSAISRAKDELISPGRYAELAEAMEVPSDGKEREEAERERSKALEVARVYRVYEEILSEKGLLDFGDLIYRAVELLKTYPDVAGLVHKEFRHLLVDEYQDINRGSAVLLKLVVGEGEGLWAVGDLRQAIYRFRGASPANVSAFEEDYPTGKELSLEINYRSQPKLVDLFSCASRQISAGSDYDGWRAFRNSTESSLIYAEAEDEAAHADGIARSIRNFEVDGFSLNDQAVLCRTNAQADCLARELEARSIPVLHLGGLFERPEVKDMLSLLSLAVEPGGSGIARAAAIDEYRMTTEQVAGILARASETGDGVVAASKGSPEEQLPAFGLLNSHLYPIAYRGDAWAFIARYLFGPARYLRDKIRAGTVTNRQARLALYQLLLTAKAFSSKTSIAVSQDDGKNDHPQRAFLAHIRHLVSIGEDTRVRVPGAAGGPPAVRIMTIHASKGLEFPVVFLPNLSQGQFPSRKRGGLVKLPPGFVPEQEDSDRQEDECLFFVGLSRARDHLVLTRARTRNGKQIQPSPLLSLIEDRFEAIGGLKEQWGTEPNVNVELHDGNVEFAVSASILSSPGAEQAPSVSSAHALEEYMSCPRKYFYSRVLNLRNAGETTPYAAFHKCLWNVIRWWRGEREAGRVPGRVELEARLSDEWQSFGPDPEHPHEQVLRARANRIVTNLTEETVEMPDDPALRRVEAKLHGSVVRVEPDAIGISIEGGIVVEKWHAGKPRDSHRNSPRLALIREGVRQEHGRAPEEIRLRYLTTGETLTIKEQPRYEPARVAKYEESLIGIEAGEFGARPSSDECPHCPFFFICPA